jgi:hypothetical protein
MTIKTFIAGTAVALVALGCATRDPMPFPVGKDCFYPACSVDVEVVDDGGGGKKLKVEGDGNLRMGTRHRLVAVIWNLRTPGYEFRGNSIRPHTSSATPGKVATATGVWERQIINHSYWYDSFSVTNRNTERLVLYYDITVYPSRGTSGQPVILDPAIMNDP